MIITNTDREPADIKAIILPHFISFEGFTDSRETVIHIKIEIIATIVITSLGIFEKPLFIFKIDLLHYKVSNGNSFTDPIFSRF